MPASLSRPEPASQPAPAKVNLALHVTARRADGYHLLDSLVVFADVADRVAIEPAERDEFRLRGPFASQLHGGDNLVLQALHRVRRRWPRRVPPLRVTLTKVLPVAAGIGGGSADAAAMLRLLAAQCDIALQDADLKAVAGELGADVPVCLDPRPARMSGIGEIVAPLADIASLPAVLVNPAVALSTARVFAQLAMSPGQTAGPGLSPPPARTLADPASLVSWLGACRNDLEDPAKTLAPAVADCLAHLASHDECLLARMSGSGATCFALCGSPAQATALARRLAADKPHWWVRATTLGSGDR